MSFGFISRRWRSKGHGVHSPLAFRLVTEVLRQSYGYYADPILATLDCPDRMAGVIHRLVCEFSPAKVWIEPALRDTDAARAVTLASSETGFTLQPLEVDFLIGADSAPHIPYTGTVVLLHTPSPAAFDSLASGCFTFSNGRSLVAVMRPDLPRQHFEVLF